MVLPRWVGLLTLKTFPFTEGSHGVVLGQKPNYPISSNLTLIKSTIRSVNHPPWSRLLSEKHTTKTDSQKIRQQWLARFLEFLKSFLIEKIAQARFVTPQFIFQDLDFVNEARRRSPLHLFGPGSESSLACRHLPFDFMAFAQIRSDRAQPSERVTVGAFEGEEEKKEEKSPWSPSRTTSAGTRRYKEDYLKSQLFVITFLLAKTRSLSTEEKNEGILRTESQSLERRRRHQSEKRQKFRCKEQSFLFR